MRFLIRTGFLVLSAALCAPGARAQIEGADEIKKLLDKVAEELAEIDRLLRESGGAGARQSAEQIRESLQQSTERSQSAQEEIQRLIDQLEQLRGGQGGGQGQPQQRPQDGSQEGQQRPERPRQENEVPPFLRQDDPQQQDQQQDQQRGGQPEGGQEIPDAGQNREGQNPPENETGPGQPGAGTDSWGELQPYVNFLKNRGGETKVPEKFRRYYEAYIRSQKKDK